jgi:threonine synthase
VTPGIERHAARLPPVAGEWVALGEGDTPVVELPRLARRLGVARLRAKLETTNPTGSYKDRIAALSMTLARERGLRGWIATSSGNAATALATYGARAGLPGLIFVTPGIPPGKLLPAQAAGAAVVEVPGIGSGGSPDTAARLFAAVREAAEAHSLFLGVTANALNPAGMRGADTIAYELAAEPEPPDVCYIPTGGGGLSVCIARGLAACGAHTRVVAAQPSGCAPIVGALEGRLARPEVAVCRTEISGLQLPLPPDGDEAVRWIRSGGGWGTAIGDEAIAAAQRALALDEGLVVEPAAAAGLAAAARDAAEGRLAPGTDALVVLTGSGLKDLGSLAAWCPPPRRLAPDGVHADIVRWLETVPAAG